MNSSSSVALTHSSLSFGERDAAYKFSKMKRAYNAIAIGDVQMHWASSAFYSISRQIHQAECMTQAQAKY